VKEENGDLLANCKNNFSQLLQVHNTTGISHTEIHTVEPLVPDPSLLEVGIATAKLEKYTLPGNDKILSN
jgi:hypothetical protein